MECRTIEGGSLVVLRLFNIQGLLDELVLARLCHMHVRRPGCLVLETKVGQILRDLHLRGVAEESQRSLGIQL